VYRSLSAFVVIAILACGTGLRAAQRTITAGEASELVDAMLRADGWAKLPGFAVNAYTISDFPDFYAVDATSNNPGGSGTIGHYAVERTTGEVWSLPVCGRYSSSALLDAQQALRDRIGLTDLEYRSLREPGPFCAPGETPHALEVGKPRSEATVHITGRVTNRIHEPIANAAVTLRDTGSKETVTATRTDQNGRFAFSAVLPRSYVLHFESSGFASLEQRITAISDMELADSVLEVGTIEGPAEPPYYVAPVAKTLEGDHLAEEQPSRKAIPRFEDFRVPTPIRSRRGPTYVSNHVPDLEKEVIEVAKGGPDFAGHFVVEQFTCGSGCTSFVVVNLETSEVFRSAFNVAYSFCSEGNEVGAELMYRPDSRLLIVNGSIEMLSHTKVEVDGPCGHFYYLWDGRSLKQISSVTPPVPRAPH
jgi:carboxypeptidase family protein